MHIGADNQQVRDTHMHVCMHRIMQVIGVLTHLIHEEQFCAILELRIPCQPYTYVQACICVEYPN